MNKFLFSFLAAITVFLMGCATNGGAGVNATPTGDATTDNSKRKAIRVTTTEKGALITADEKILFDTGRAEIKPSGMVLIENVVEILQQKKPKAKVSVEGHTDNVGGDTLNENLSQRRATAVRSALIKGGVDAKRISSRGFGLSKPIANNSTEDGRLLNRRTEIIILGETAESIGGAGLGDRILAGIDRFLKDPVGAIKSVFN